MYVTCMQVEIKMVWTGTHQDLIKMRETIDANGQKKKKSTAI